MLPTNDALLSPTVLYKSKCITPYSLCKCVNRYASLLPCRFVPSRPSSHCLEVPKRTKSMHPLRRTPLHHLIIALTVTRNKNYLRPEPRPGIP
jgi:hypothetical protein